jgi:hypothetical protein
LRNAVEKLRSRQIDLKERAAAAKIVANLKLTFHPDHSVGANQWLRDACSLIHHLAQPSRVTYHFLYLKAERLNSASRISA